MEIEAIEKFLKKNQIANQTQSKEVRFTIKEMNEISSSLASVLSNVVALLLEKEKIEKQIQDLQNQLDSNEINLDGGGFKN